MYLLGIETSCDETAAAVIDDRGTVVADVLASQADLHAQFGGVVPELACRRHVEIIGDLLGDVLDQAGISRQDLDAVAVTVGPGLIGALLVGVSLSKSLSYTLGIPFIPVHHLEGHICATYLEHSDLIYPSVALVVSGGHTNLYEMPEAGCYRLLGRTIDDAAGEALDKAAKMLSLGYPGGPILDRLARQGDPERISFPRPFRGREILDFSFSGLKTALRHFLSENTSHVGNAEQLAHIAASYQEAVVEVLVEKSLAAVQQYRARTLIVAGGVAANSRLRERLRESTSAMGVSLRIPSPRYCTDNGAMIAMAGLERFRRGVVGSLDFNPKPDLDLTEGW